jgi:hypothetical protein
VIREAFPGIQLDLMWYSDEQWSANHRNNSFKTCLI